MKQLTEEQKAAIEKAGDIYLDEGINWKSEDERYQLSQMAFDSFHYGALEVITNPEKYGLIEISEAALSSRKQLIEIKGK